MCYSIKTNTMLKYIVKLSILFTAMPLALFAQQDTPDIPITIVVATDGSSPHTTSITYDNHDDGSIDANLATPSSSQQWTQVSTSGHLNFGRSIDFGLTNVVTPSMRGSMSGSYVSPTVIDENTYVLSNNNNNYGAYHTGNFYQCISGSASESQTFTGSCCTGFLKAAVPPRPQALFQSMPKVHFPMA